LSASAFLGGLACALPLLTVALLFVGAGCRGLPASAGPRPESAMFFLVNP
jgi:hypothetical protein